MQRAEASAGAEIQMLAPRPGLKHIAQPLIHRQPKTFHKRISQHDGTRTIGMNIALNIARAIAVGEYSKLKQPS